MIVIDINGQHSFIISPNGEVIERYTFPTQVNPVSGVVGREIFQVDRNVACGNIGEEGYRTILNSNFRVKQQLPMPWIPEEDTPIVFCSTAKELLDQLLKNKLV